jgi:hypothetical protein
MGCLKYGKRFAGAERNFLACRMFDRAKPISTSAPNPAVDALWNPGRGPNWVPVVVKGSLQAAGLRLHVPLQLRANPSDIFHKVD